MFIFIGFRDPYGIRPLSFGSQLNSQETVNGYAFASESVAINAISPDFTFQRDVAPGEAIFIDSDFNCHSQVCHTNPMLTPCIFEHVYFARPDSVFIYYKHFFLSVYLFIYLLIH